MMILFGLIIFWLYTSLVIGIGFRIGVTSENARWERMAQRAYLKDKLARIERKQAQEAAKSRWELN